MENFGLYLVITNPTVGYEECARAAVKAGVKIIQLRMKHVSREEIIEEAKKLRAVTKGTDTLFIVNDDPEIAALVEADGVHVGQGDMSPKEVRAKYPTLKIVGLSTHNIDQVKASLDEPIDYIGVGPVYATPTKDIPDPTLGPDTAAEMIRLSKVPAVAIGGLDLETVKPVIAKGAKNFAIVRAVCKSLDPYAEIVKLQNALLA